MIYVQMLFEWLTLSQRMVGWKKDLMFKQQYQVNNDASETFLRSQINNLMLNADAENNQVFDQGDSANKKSHKLSANFFTATYCSLMKSNKTKFKMKEADQIELFWKTCFIYIVQVSFCYVIWAYAGFK